VVLGSIPLGTMVSAGLHLVSVLGIVVVMLLADRGAVKSEVPPIVSG